jgi:protein TonB
MVTPIYPTEERENRVQGTVVLSVDVSAEGTVTNVQVDKPVAGHPAFSGAAIAAVRQWRFEPARSNGQPVAVTISVPVRFALE